jgi:LuxR family transcriptional regulator
MKVWQIDQLQTFRLTKGDQTLFQATSILAEELGFEFCALSMHAPLPASNPTTAVITNYPEAWQLAYQHNNYFAIDPTVRHGLRSQNMLIWSDMAFAETPDFWEEAQAAGLRVGLALPTRGTHDVIGMLSLARSDEQISSVELKDKQFKLAWLAQIANLGMSQHLIPKLMPATEIQLTDRELSALRWVAEGKTSEDIADILRIAERTVNFHINNAVTKLGTTNRTAAAVQAAQLGLL